MPSGAIAPPAYAIPETEVVDIHSTRLDRDYQLFVALPESYASHPRRRYPVVFVTDANYAFPLVRAISRRVGDHAGIGLAVPRAQADSLINRSLAIPLEHK